MKYSRLKESKNQIEVLKVPTKKFIQELKDVNISLQLNINISDTLKFFDWFFDGIFADYVVRKRIVEAEEAIENQINQVKSILLNLKFRLNENKKSLSNLQKEKEQFLLGGNNA